MKKIVSALLVAGLLAILLIVGGAHRHTVVKPVAEPEQTADGQDEDVPDDIDENLDDTDDVSRDDTDQNENDADQTEVADGIKIGVILIGDETENYSRSHIEAIVKAAENIGIAADDIEWKERIDNSDESYDAVSELLDDGCNLLIANAQVQQDALMDAAEENPDASFVVIGGDKAAVSGLTNYYNAYTDIYEARYLSGVVAGMKLAQLDKKGKISKYGYNKYNRVRVGYIATYPNAEAISGYSAFYLGMKSVMKNVALEVYYTNTWMDMDAEATAADKMIRSGCVLIAQQSDSTSVAETIEKAWKKGRHVYYIGSGEAADAAAEDAVLTSAVSDWSVYYMQLFTALSEEKDFAQDWSQGLSEGAVSITKLGKHVAPKTAEKVKKVQKKLTNGKLYVFDITKFTVGGMRIGDADASVDLTAPDSTEEPAEDDIVKSALTSYDGGTYFAESVLRSAPYFELHIDGIKEMNLTEEE